MAHIVLISGSHRPTGNTARIARFVEKELQSRGHSTYLLDLATTHLPQWDEGMWGVAPLNEKWGQVWQPHANEIEKASAFVMLTPEYHGMVPSALKNVLLLLGNGPLAAHKPALIVAVSASINGAYPVAELRATGGKNNRICWLPEHLIVRTAAEMFQPNPKPEHAEHDTTIRKRLAWCLTLLEDYIPALETVRKAGHTMNADFANGM